MPEDSFIHIQTSPNIDFDKSIFEKKKRGNSRIDSIATAKPKTKLLMAFVIDNLKSESSRISLSCYFQNTVT